MDDLTQKQIDVLTAQKVLFEKQYALRCAQIDKQIADLSSQQIPNEPPQ